MCTYKGNVGNLMQHWTLCEILTVAQRHASRLSYVDAHAMAPVASVQSERKDERRQTFDCVRDGRPGRESVYERAWHRLTPNGQGYPNSAAFVEDVWNGRVSMLLCEMDPSTAAKLRAWAQGRTEATVIEGDWRTSFKDGLPDAPMTLLSFDPYSYDRTPSVKKRSYLYPSDLKLIVDALDGVQGGILIQLSTYGVKRGDSQEAVALSVKEILQKGRLRLAAVVKVNESMMSLVYVRGIDWYADGCGSSSSTAQGASASGMARAT
ncbi:MAG: hypothetical protein OXG04_24370 [Acidobacteria bacterium]|nr:hypothetical protein [Acidobacteriota bacterium]